MSRLFIADKTSVSVPMVCAERLVHFALQTLFTAGIVIAMLTRATRVLSVERKFENTFNVKSQVLPQ